MAVAVAVTNSEYSAADLRRLMSKERDGQVVRRLSALALILEGHSRTQAAQQSGMDRQTLCDWVHRYNAGGVAALVSGKSTGRRRSWTWRRGRSFMISWSKALLLRLMGSCAGGALICGRKSRAVFRLMCLSVRLPNGCASWGLPGCSRGHSIPAKTWRHRKHLKKLLQPGHRSFASQRGRQGARGLVLG